MSEACKPPSRRICIGTGWTIEEAERLLEGRTDRILIILDGEWRVIGYHDLTSIRHCPSGSALGPLTVEATMLPL